LEPFVKHYGGHTSPYVSGKREKLSL
jgi:hypothetical protein